MEKSVLLKRSGDFEKEPLVDDIKIGELALNYSKGSEKLYIKNSENEIIDLFNTESMFNKIYDGLVAKITEEFPDLLKKEIIYTYEGEGQGNQKIKANFDETIIVDKNFKDYDYIEVYCKSDDGWGFSQKIENPNNETIAFTTANVTGGGQFVMKTRAYFFSENTISTAKGWQPGQILAGCWLSAKNGANPYNATTTQGYTYIGISHVVGYRKF